MGGLFPPRFDYDPVTLAPKGLLVEEQRTNLLTYSEQFDNAVWSKTRASTVANAATAPDGTMNAEKLVEDTTATSTHTAIQFVTIATATTYTFSVYLKAAERTFARVLVGETTAGARVDVNLSNGAISSGVVGSGWTLVGATATAVGNGWYRVTVTGTSGANTAGQAYVYAASALGTIIYTGDGTSGIFVWGAQLEAGSFATSYIPTVASQVTRSADVATITGANFSQFYNQSEGTFVVEFSALKPTSVVATALVVDASDGGINNRHYLGVVSGLGETRTATGGVVQVSLTQAYVANQVEKYAYAVKANDFAFARNGSLVGTDTSGSMPTIDRMFLGNAAGSAAYLNGHIRSIRYYPTRLQDSQLQALTA